MQACCNASCRVSASSSCGGARGGVKMNAASAVRRTFPMNEQVFILDHCRDRKWNYINCGSV